MATDYYYPTSKNAIQKTLAAQLLSTASTGDAITFADVDGIQNKPGVLVINRVDSNGTATPSSREYISYTGTSGTTVLIDTRNVDSSGAARTHAVGSIVEFVADAVWAQRIIDQALVAHNVDGTHKSGSVLTLPQINDTSSDHQYVLAVNELTADRTVTLPLLTAADEFVFQAHGLTSSANSNFTYHGLARQAIMNPGGGEYINIVNQRGAFTGASNTWSSHKTYYGPDRWLIYSSDTTSMVLNNPTNHPGYIDTYKNNSTATNKTAIIQIIESVNSYALRGKTLTFSFKAGYNNTWTGDLSVGILAMKAAGTADDLANAPISDFAADGTRPTFNSTNYDVIYQGDVAAASCNGTTIISGTSTAVPADAKNLVFVVVNKTSFTAADAYAGFKIKEVQLNAGSVALPFQPKSFEEELRACQRYCYALTLGTVTKVVGFGMNAATNVNYSFLPLPVTMRTTPTLTATAGDYYVYELGSGGADVTAIALDDTSLTNRHNVVLRAQVASGLTQFRPAYLVADGSAERTLILSAEL